MRRIELPSRAEWPAILERPMSGDRSAECRAREIVGRVRRCGDAALIELTAELDGVDLESLWVSPREMREAEESLDPSLRRAIRTAMENIQRYHSAQARESETVETSPGVRCWRKSVPISRIGIYVPGGSAPLFSSLLMAGVPARIAGCGEIVVASPPDRSGKVADPILHVASLLGIERILKVGGAQAISALAFGTESVPRCFKIFGPGNRWVTEAKRLAASEGVAIDMPAGPSEVAVIADSSADAAIVAADLLSQAEHGADSQVLLATDSPELLDAVERELASQLELLPRAGVARTALSGSLAILVEQLEEAIDLVNEYAPEHLIVMTRDAESLAERVTNAGSVFLGEHSPESAGDYASGTNHVLPTGGAARHTSGLSLQSFTKEISFQRLTRDGLAGLAETIETMAAAEGLEAHRRAVAIRFGRA